MAQQIGTVIRLVEPQNQMDSCQHFDKSRMRELMGCRLTLAEATELGKIAASAPAERSDPASPEQVAKHLQFIAATLPSRNVDEETGRQRFTVYVRMLGGYSDDALKFMSVEILRSYDWFPTPRQCLTVLEKYCAPIGEVDRASIIAARFVEDHFDDWFARLKTVPVVQDEIDDVPERWKRIARERGALRFDPAHGYTQRFKAEEEVTSCAA